MTEAVEQVLLRLAFTGTIDSAALESGLTSKTILAPLGHIKHDDYLGLGQVADKNMSYGIGVLFTPKGMTAQIRDLLPINPLSINSLSADSKISPGIGILMIDKAPNLAIVDRCLESNKSLPPQDRAKWYSKVENFTEKARYNEKLLNSLMMAGQFDYMYDRETQDSKYVTIMKKDDSMVADIVAKKGDDKGVEDAGELWHALILPNEGVAPKWISIKKDNYSTAGWKQGLEEILRDAFACVEEHQHKRRQNMTKQTVT